jgi:hypothetical protein
MIWNRQVQSDRTIHHNKPDIIVGDNEEETAYSEDRSVIKKEPEKIF